MELRHSSWRGRGERADILIAHEQPTQRQLIDILLSPSGHDITFLADGRAALTLLRERTPDLAMLSATLYGIGGIDICAKMKSIGRLRQVPVILVLPERNDPTVRSIVRRLRYAEPDLTLHVPLSDKNLRERVDSCLRQGAGTLGGSLR